MIRPIFAETERYGEYSKAGEFVYDHPFQWGSRRIGPDLARQGGKNSVLWHIEHFRNPSELVKGSVMPVYSHFEQTKLNFKEIPSRVWAAKMLGAPYEAELDNGIAMAQEQAAKLVKDLVDQGGKAQVTGADGQPIELAETQAIALIAYLQRLGTDLYATPPAVEPPAAGSPATAEASGKPEGTAPAAGTAAAVSGLSPTTADSRPAGGQ
jgi:cytochrome c oxidase cbb3-type subunit I/II